MEEYLASLLEKMDVPAYYVTRKNSQKFPYIIYEFIESPNGNSDDEEEITNYEVFFNIYAGNDIIDIKRKLMKLLKENGFHKKIVPVSMYYDDLECFEQALQYSKVADF